MTLTTGDEFSKAATPSQELLLKLAALADSGSGAVLSASTQDKGGLAHRGSSEPASEMIRMARLADPAYQAMSVRIDDDLDRMDVEDVDSLQKIEEALSELRLKREQFLAQTYKDATGRPIAMTRDGTAAYYVDGAGGQVDDEAFLQLRPDLLGRPTVDDFTEIQKQDDALGKLSDDIHKDLTERQQLRDDLAAGSVSGADAQKRLDELRDAGSATLDAADAALLGVRRDDAAPDGLATDRASGQSVPPAPLVPR